MSQVKTGDIAPPVNLTLHDGTKISLADFRGEQAVVLFFYPKDGSPICTKQVCAFRDAYEDFGKVGAVVIGISGDSPERHQQFASKHRLPFLLASDPDEHVRHAFGVPSTFGVLPGRSTYVIDKQGIVQMVFNSQFAADRHVREAIQAITTADQGDS